MTIRGICANIIERPFGLSSRHELGDDLTFSCQRLEGNLDQALSPLTLDAGRLEHLGAPIDLHFCFKLSMGKTSRGSSCTGIEIKLFHSGGAYVNINTNLQTGTKKRDLDELREVIVELLRRLHWNEPDLGLEGFPAQDLPDIPDLDGPTVGQKVVSDDTDVSEVTDRVISVFPEIGELSAAMQKAFLPAFTLIAEEMKTRTHNYETEAKRKRRNAKLSKALADIPNGTPMIRRTEAERFLPLLVSRESRAIRGFYTNRACNRDLTPGVREAYRPFADFDRTRLSELGLSAHERIKMMKEIAEHADTTDALVARHPVLAPDEDEVAALLKDQADAAA